MSGSEKSESEKELQERIDSLERRIEQLERPDLNKDGQLPEHWNDRYGYPAGIPNGCGYYTIDGR